MSASSAASASPSAASPIPLSTQDRTSPASSRSALSDLPDSGSRRAPRSGTATSAGVRSATDSGSETAIGRAAPAGRWSASAAAPGLPYPSSTTWAFVPDQPKPLTPALGGRPSASGQAVGSAVTLSGSRSQGISGFGVLKWRCLGMTPLFIASSTLMTPATPAADSRWPMFVFTEPIRSGRSGSRPRP